MELTSDTIIENLNKVLYKEEINLISDFTTPKLPVIFIVGAPRSGTTLLEQVIINHFHITYINNIVAKFWLAPYMGFHLYKSLKKKQQKINYVSEFGFTENYDGPHEFGYFWKRFFHYGETHQLTTKQYDEIDSELLNKEIAAIESVFNLPVIFKNPVALSLHIDYLSRHIPNSLFLYIKRDAVFNAQSIYQNRLKYSGNAQEWFSVKPKEYDFLKEKDIYSQIAGQVFYTNKKIEEDLNKLDSRRYLQINYEEFCLSTNVFCAAFKNWLKRNNYNIQEKELQSNDSLQDTNKIAIDKDIFHQLETAVKKYSI
jgi:hypothetical protein